MGLVDKIKNFVAPEEEEDEEVLEYDDEEVETISQYEAPKSQVKKVASDTKMVLFEPRSFDEDEEIARHLKSRRAAVVNLNKLQRDYTQLYSHAENMNYEYSTKLKSLNYIEDKNFVLERENNELRNKIGRYVRPYSFNK